MASESLKDLNTKRLKVQLSKLLSQIRPEIANEFKKCGIYDANGKEVLLSDIDFTKTTLFISQIDFSSLISVYALQKINNVVYPDNTPGGTYSRIRTSYMIVNSSDIRYSKTTLAYTEEEYASGHVPDMYDPANYVFKDLCIWLLLQSVGQGKDENMYALCNERLFERYLQNKLDWIFFIGNKYDYEKTYNIPLNIPQFIIKYKNNTGVEIQTESKKDTGKEGGNLF